MPTPKEYTNTTLSYKFYLRENKQCLGVLGSWITRFIDSKDLEKLKSKQNLDILGIRTIQIQCRHQNYRYKN